jgi:hypothetical protein
MLIFDTPPGFGAVFNTHLTLVLSGGGGGGFVP